MNKNKEEKNDSYINWLQTASDEEKNLQDIMFDYEEKYFQDMTFKKIDRRLTKTRVDGKSSDSIPDIFINLWDWKIKLRNLRTSEGRCHGKENTIFIKKRLDTKSRKETLLHEMVHAYEHLLSKYPHFMEELLLIQLYNKLKPKIKRLDEYIYSSNHFDFRVNSHGVLFLLKSLELDLRLKKQFGTIFSYGREVFFK